MMPEIGTRAERSCSGVEADAEDMALRLRRLLEVDAGYQRLLKVNSVRGVARDIVDHFMASP